MLTEAQFREIANSLQEIVTELKKMNEQPKPPQPVFHVRNSPESAIRQHLQDLGYYQRNNHNFERSDHSGPSIS